MKALDKAVDMPVLKSRYLYLYQLSILFLSDGINRK
jgi:hypothetical protein